MNSRKQLPAVAALALLAACLVAGCKGGASVTVDIKVPRPLVEPLDVRMGVYFDDALTEYVHEEELDDHGSYRIDIGASQEPVFKMVFDAMFDSVVPMTVETAPSEATAQYAEDEEAEEQTTRTIFRSLGDGGLPVDGILVPSIQEVQFAIPDQTGGEFYEVWIRYQLALFGADGQPLGAWPLIGYGKANQRNYGTIDQKTTGLNEATIWALRDAAALLSFQFREQAQVKAWLAATSGGTP
jgi:hypothetical protein